MERKAVVPHKDGGKPPAFERVPVGPGQDSQCLRLVYTGGDTPGWRNLRLPLWLSGVEAEFRFRPRVENADPKAALHIWFFEEDGDGWLSPSLPLADRNKTWADVALTIGDFRYQPRGDRTMDLRSVNRMFGE